MTPKAPLPRRLLAKRIIPESISSLLGECRGMPIAKALSYLRLRAWRRLGLRSDRSILRRLKPESILFVCHGNVLRSPMAAELFRVRAAGRGRPVGVLSAGIWALNGRPADPRAIAAARKLGVSLESHLSRSVTATLVARSDLICVMDYRNEVDLVTRFPDARKKTILLGAFDARQGRSPEIGDPVALDMEGVEQCYARMLSAVEALIEAIVE